MRRSMPDPGGWLASRRARFGRKAILLLFAFSTFGSLFASTPPSTARADELDDAYRRQKALESLITKQRSSIKSLTASQANLSAKISNTKDSLAEINADLLTVK